MRLRIRDELSGQVNIIELAEDAKVKDLSLHVPGLESCSQTRNGSKIDLSNPETLLSVLGIRSMDNLFIQKSAVLEVNEEARMIIRRIPDDNACLFNAIAHVLARQPRHTAQELRQIVAHAILSNPEIYSEVVLEREPEEYAAWIQRSNSWGGAIELAILAKHFSCQIASIDVQSGRMDLYEPDHYTSPLERLYLLYSGIHYDAIVLNLGNPELPSPEYDITRFDPHDKLMEAQARSLADEARRNHGYTDLARFTLCCSICKEALVGQRDAAKHASLTGHSEFVEY